MNHRIGSLAFYLLISLIFANCLKSSSRQMGLQDWVGVHLDSGEEISFENFPEDVLLLNVYAPNCVPCWKEIPALNRIRERLESDPRFGIVMIVDPVFLYENQEKEDKKDSSVDSSREGVGEDPWERAREIMKKERQERNIKLPIYLMKPPFKISPDSFVTGTPETILVRTRPWNLYYNFIGSISDKNIPEEIDSDAKVKFLLSKMGARGL